MNIFLFLSIYFNTCKIKIICIANKENEYGKRSKEIVTGKDCTEGRID